MASFRYEMKTSPPHVRESIHTEEATGLMIGWSSHVIKILTRLEWENIFGGFLFGIKIVLDYVCIRLFNGFLILVTDKYIIVYTCTTLK